MDILLINPGKIRHDYITEHLGIAGLKSFVNLKGFSADTLDMSIEKLSVMDGVKHVRELKPRMVGVSLLDDSKERGLSLIRALCSAGYKGHIVVGGYFATFSAKEILRDFPEIDFVVRGEGELTLCELMKTVLKKNDRRLKEIRGLTFRENDNIVENPARPLIQNLDDLPPVDRKYAAQVLKQGSHLRISGTRGCWGQCSFCDIIGFYRSAPGKVWRSRSVTHLVDEIEYLTKKFNTDYFVFNDDQFLLKGKKALERVNDFAGELARRNLNIRFELMCRADTVSKPVFSRLKEAGLQRVFIGLESFNEKHLQIYRKRISFRQNLKAVIILYQLKLDVIASVILANAYTTFRDLIKQFIILYQLKNRYFNSPRCQISVNNKLEIYKGSRVYQEYLQKGLLTRNDYLQGYDFKLKFWTGLRLGLFEAEAKISRLVLRPVRVFLNQIRYIGWSFRQLKTYLAAYFPGKLAVLLKK